MTGSALLNEILDLPADERLQLVEEIWDSLALSAESVPVPDWHKAELDRRLDDPSDHATLSWEDVQIRMRQRKA
ncbi:MAG: addiction module protein [Gemmatimonadaceae bacterium]|nr:addiction module protein [Gemmatimonadaceae bacterium]